MGRKRKGDRELPPRVYRHGRSWRLRIYDGEGRAGWHNFKATDLDELFREYARYFRSKKVLTMGDLFDRYIAEEHPRKAPETARSNNAAFKKLRPFFGDINPASVQAFHVIRYLDERRDSAPTRGNREKSLLSHVFTKGRHWGLVDNNPCAGLAYRNPEAPRTRYVTDAEFRLALRLAPPWLRYFMHLAYRTGLRRRDLVAMRWDQWTADGLLVEISKARRKDAAPKRLLFQYDPAFLRLREKIRAHSVENSDQCFDLGIERDASFRAADSTLDKAWGILQRKLGGAGVERFQLRDLRAKHATDIDAHGGDATEHLGHSSSSTTKRHYKRRPVTIKWR